MVDYKLLMREEWDFAQLEDFFHKSWFPQEKGSNGTMDFTASDLENLFTNFENQVVIEARDGNELVGLVTGFPQELSLANTKFKGLVPMFLFVLEPFRRKKIATTLMKMLLEFAEKSGFGLMVASPERSGNGHKVLEKLGWRPQAKFESKIAFAQFDKLAEYKDFNVVERTVAGKWAKDQKKVPGISEGFRKATDADYPAIVELLNECPATIKRMWTEETYKKFLKLSGYYDGTSWVWEKDGKIVATGITTVHSIHWANGEGFTLFLRQVGIKEELPIEESIKFFGQMLNLARSHEKDVIALKMPVGQHIEKILKKAEFHGDQKGRLFMVYPIKKEAQDLMPEKKIKKFYFDTI
ncbi:MAG: GNAT family N-acetyltransferase [Candidatus Helarchaeota archaeon]